MLKKIMSVIVITIICMMNIIQISVFADETVNIYSNGARMTTNNNDIFYIDNAKPGDEWTTNIHVVNDSTLPFTLTLLKIIDSKESILPSFMYLKISNNDTILYDGEYKTDTTPYFEPILIDKKSNTDITIKCGIKGKTDNIIQNEHLETSWIFEGKGISVDAEEPNVSNSTGKTQRIALGSNIIIPAQDTVICYDEYGNVIFSGLEERFMGMWVKAPEIEGYEAENKLISIFNSLNGKYTFLYHKIDAFDKETKNNDYTQNVNYSDTENENDNHNNISTEKTENNMQSDTDKLNAITKIVNVFNNSTSNSKNNNYVSEKEQTDNTSLENKSNEITQKNNENNDNNDNSSNKIVEHIIEGLKSNTILITWCIFVFILTIIILVIITVKKIRKNRH